MVETANVGQALADEFESCPFCAYGVIMEDSKEQAKLFHCQNPECMKISCRLCRNESHEPKSCEGISYIYLTLIINTQNSSVKSR